MEHLAEMIAKDTAGRDSPRRVLAPDGLSSVQLTPASVVRRTIWHP